MANGKIKKKLLTVTGITLTGRLVRLLALRTSSVQSDVLPRYKLRLLELSLETKPSLLPVGQYGTVCLSMSDQLRLLLVLSAS